MKHLLTLVTLLAAVLFAIAGSPSKEDWKNGNIPPENPFKLDESQVYEATLGLSDLEQYIITNPGTTLSDLEKSESELIEGLSLGSGGNLNALSPMSEGPLGISSFLWGFCLGLIGLLIVYLVTEDKDELKKALWGLLAAVGLYLVIYAILLATYL